MTPTLFAQLDARVGTLRRFGAGHIVATVLLLAVTLSACATPSGGTAPGDSPAAAEPGEGMTSVVPIVQPSAKEIAQERATETTRRIDAPARPEHPAAAMPQPSEADMMAARSHKPEELMGLGPDAIRKLLGNPVLVRQDTPAEIWQYRGRDCVLDLFLYPPSGRAKSSAARNPPSDDARTVLYYELRGADAKKLTGDSCFISLVAAAHAARSS